IDSGRLEIHASRPSLYGLEMHLATMHKHVVEFAPRTLILDPISNLNQAGAASGPMLVRLVDFLKNRGITALFTSLTSDPQRPESTDAGVSSLMDTWLLVRNLETIGER